MDGLPAGKVSGCHVVVHPCIFRLLQWLRADANSFVLSLTGPRWASPALGACGKQQSFALDIQCHINGFFQHHSMPQHLHTALLC